MFIETFENVIKRHYATRLAGWTIRQADAVEHAIRHIGREAFVNLATNMVSSTIASHHHAPTQEEINRWDHERQQVIHWLRQHGIID